MKLLELLVKELPKRGGWPEGADYVVQDCDGSCDIKFGSGYGYPILDDRGVWVNDIRRDWGIDTDESYIRDFEILASDASTSIITREQYEAALQPAWNGEGLPPVGSKVESFINGEWKLVKVVYTGEPGGEYEALVFDVKTTKPAWSDLFRPTRTEADRKREEAINAISLAYDTQDRFGNYRAATGVYEDIAAGKIPGVELSK